MARASIAIAQPAKSLPVLLIAKLGDKLAATVAVIAHAAAGTHNMGQRHIGSTGCAQDRSRVREYRNLRLTQFADSPLLKAFGQAGVSVFVAPSAIENKICRQDRVRPIGELPDIRDRFCAISVERKLKQPAVIVISKTARGKLLT